MATKVGEFIQQSAENPNLAIKIINWIAAALGIGTFLQLVNVVVGILSAGWLCIQIYGYIKYELPQKRARHKITMRELNQKE